MTREVLGGIRAIKLYAWEEPYQQRILALRDAELSQIRRAALLSAANSILFLGGPVVVALASFSVFGALGGRLTAEVAFPALALFNLLRHPLMMLPSQIVSLINAQVALKRVQDFMESEEATGACLGPPAGPGGLALAIHKGTFSWEAGGPAMLHDMEVEVKTGQLVMVVGEVGCGKSSLLSAFLGEMYSECADIRLSGSLAYCAQDPWIQNASLRDNILMGRPFEEGRYAAVLEACALLPDLATLQAGDATEIGEKGVNLSGGQRHRVALARAAYSGADVYLLDDPLSAVDAHVGRHLFTSCICGLLGGSTRILVTHQLQYLRAADEVIVLSGGGITHRGTYDDLCTAGVQFVQFESIRSPPSGDACGHVSRSETGAGIESSPPSTSHESGTGNFSPSVASAAIGASPSGPSTSRTAPASFGGSLSCTAVPSDAAGPVERQGALAGLAIYGTPPTKLSVPPRGAAKWESELSLESPATVLSPVSPEGSSSTWTPSGSPESSFAEDALPAGLFPLVEPHQATHRAAPDTLLHCQDSMNLGSREREEPSSSATDAGPAVPQYSTAGDDANVSQGTLETGSGRETLLRVSSREMWAAGVGSAKFCNGGPAVLIAVQEDETGEQPTSPSGATQCPTGGTLKSGPSELYKGRYPEVQAQDEPQSDERRRLLENSAPMGGPPGESQGWRTRRVAEPEGADGIENRGDGKRGRLIVAEERAVGKVERDMYLAYLGAWGPMFVLPLAVAGLVASERGCQVLQNWWLSVWSSATSSATSSSGASEAGFSNSPYLAVYVLFGVLSLGLQGGRLTTMVVGSLTAAKRLHAQLLQHTLRLPMSFFDSQPLGRLLNRFARDTEAVDIKVPEALGSFITSLVNVLFSLLVVVAVSPLAVVAVVPLGVMYEYVRRRYVATSRELKRLDSIALSPIFSTFNETLQGLVTIRAYKRQAAFHAGNQDLIDRSTRCQWPIPQVNRYLAMRLELLGSTIILVAATTAAVIIPRSAALAGLAITASLNLTGVLNWLVRQSTELEVQMNGVERVRAYLRLPTEAPAIVEARRPPAAWPSKGNIAVQDLVVRYRPELPPVLRGLSFEVGAGEKVGIAGRTGCGKSTLMMALYRMLEAESGRIVIDSLDIAALGLFDLRSRLALVPQDPVLFRGSVRDNLDPFGTSGGDAAIWEALERAGLKPTIRELQGGLEAEVEEGGGNLSTGQRQLLCMARALLRKTRILVLDEATSSVDSETDALIQATVREAFVECTVLTVAHRLHTIADCNRILVLDAGRVHEFDTPGNLLQDTSSAFFKLVQETEKARVAVQQMSPASSKLDLGTIIENTQEGMRP
eukprot:jgi/Botrbrau1/21222/Bobra.39_2s0023.1